MIMGSPLQGPLCYSRNPQQHTFSTNIYIFCICICTCVLCYCQEFTLPQLHLTRSIPRYSKKKFNKFIIVLKDPRLHCKEEWVSGNNGPTIVRVARMGFGCIIEQGRMHDFPDAGGRTDLVHRPLCVLKWGSKN